MLPGAARLVAAEVCEAVGVLALTCWFRTVPKGACGWLSLPLAAGFAAIALLCAGVLAADDTVVASEEERSVIWHPVEKHQAPRHRPYIWLIKFRASFLRARFPAA